MSPLGDLRQVAQCLSAGGVIAHATEGVWGFACLANEQAAILRILSIKQRAAEQGLLLIGADAQMFAPELDALDDAAHRRRVEDSWPGPHTWVLPNARFSNLVVGRHEGVACRVPGHDQARAVCELIGAPLVSTSANRAGEPPCLTQAQVLTQFADNLDSTAPDGQALDMVLEGAVLRPGAPSSIYALDGSQLRGTSHQIPSESKGEPKGGSNEGTSQ